MGQTRRFLKNRPVFSIITPAPPPPEKLQTFHCIFTMIEGGGGGEGVSVI